MGLIVALQCHLFLYSQLARFRYFLIRLCALALHYFVLQPNCSAKLAEVLKDQTNQPAHVTARNYTSLRSFFRLIYAAGSLSFLLSGRIVARVFSSLRSSPSTHTLIIARICYTADGGLSIQRSRSGQKLRKQIVMGSLEFP